MDKELEFVLGLETVLRLDATCRVDAGGFVADGEDFGEALLELAVAVLALDVDLASDGYRLD